MSTIKSNHIENILPFSSWNDVLKIIQADSFNVAQFSRDTGISADRIHKWKSGKASAKFDDALKLIAWAMKNKIGVQQESTDDQLIKIKDILSEIGGNFQDLSNSINQALNKS
jgi:hypothetical protein